MSKRHSTYSAQAPSRRAVYRAAKRLLVREARRVWRGPVHGIARRVRAFLRGKSRSYIIRLLTRPAAILAVVVSLALGSPAHAIGPIELSDVAAGDGGFVINGIDPGDQSGGRVAGAGDVNGDFVPDVIIGAPFADPGDMHHAGETHVIFGKATNTPIELADVTAGNGGFVISGIEPDDSSGWSVSGAGDVNGDGLADVIIGAPNGDPYGNDNAGESYVVFGKSTTAPVSLVDVVAGSGGFVVNGVAPLDVSGLSVSGAGDVNGDGLDDVVVGAPGVDPAGAAYVIFGKTTTTAVNLSDIAAGMGGFAFIGVGDDGVGRSISRAGDVNGDGLADLILGAAGAHPGGIDDAGKSFVVFGKITTAPVDPSDIDAGNGGFVINGIDPNDRSGGSVSGAGDVNGDGLADVIIGASGADPYGNDSAGEGYVVFGKTTTTAVNLSDVASGIGGFIINGADGIPIGRSVSGVGDVNGDGLADVILGSSTTTPEQRFVVFGRTSTGPVSIFGIATSGGDGFVIQGAGGRDAMSGLGDMNADFVADILIGAELGDPGGRSNAGQTYVIFSPFQRAVPASGWFSRAMLALFLASAGSFTVWRLAKRERVRARRLE